MIIKNRANGIWTIEDDSGTREVSSEELIELIGNSLPLYFIKDPERSLNKDLIKLFEQGDCI